MKGSRYAGDLVSELEGRLASYRPRRKGLPAKALQQLGGMFLKRADERYLLEHAGDGWLGHLEELLAFMQQRKEGEILVHVSEPEAREGHTGRSTVVNTCVQDQAFIVDSLRLCFEQRGLELRSQVNMILPVQRTKAGKLQAIGGEHEAFPLESVTHFEVSAIDDPAERKALQDDITSRLIQARAMVVDFHRMLRKVKDLIVHYEFLASVKGMDGEQLQEARDFLDWLSYDHFVFMGVSPVPMGPAGGGRKSKAKSKAKAKSSTKAKPAVVAAAEDGERLGLARMVDTPFVHSEPGLSQFLKGKRGRPFLLVHKTSQESVIHRRGKIDEILVRQFDDKGRVVGAVAIHGLFTYRAITARGGSVPMLRSKLSTVVEQEEVTKGSYNYKSIVNAFNSLPVEYLFGAPVSDIRQLVRRSLAAERSRRLEVHLSISESKRSAYLFVVMPRQNFNDEMRSRLQDAMMDRMGASYCDHRVEISNYGVAILHYYFTAEKSFKGIDHAELEREVVALSASWQDRFREVLLDRLDRDDALDLYRNYHGAFSQRYQVSTEAEQVLVDIMHLEEVRHHGGVRLDLYRDQEDADQHTIKLRFYEAQNLYLSAILPVLDNFGLVVVNSFANRVRLADGMMFMDTFRFRLEGHEHLLEEPHRQHFLDAVMAAFDGRMANDSLNRLLLPGRLSWEEVDLVRSYMAYGKQLGLLTTPGSVWSTLVAHAGTVRLIVEWFRAKFGPDGKGQLPTRPGNTRKRRNRELREEVYHRIDGVQGYNEDRILRTLATLVDATLRTSFFHAGRPHESLAFKFDCSLLPWLSEPRPWREIWVHHAELEGVHLRGGRVARGGLRWSDRNDDFRTEILGLMTTQMVKNVVIVPVGAKGGFVLRHPPADRNERRQRADELYKLFIHALLDVTDNLEAGETVPPAGVVCWDEPDPYLVVAADKGTAHLSDTANAISEERGFWMGDAFASGGSNGYDHKEIGITARGAWVCIDHLLREMGTDPDTDEFTVAGIGDMGGDVFGNGLIEHEGIRLLAAFNHLHIFLDPDPDTKKSFQERKRLFTAKSGGWDQYDTKLISKGGGVFERQAKSIPLSPQVQAMFGTERNSMSANEVIQEILKLQVDLLYNGGIGTYVKATAEDHSDASDPSNDAVRVDASELRCRVIGEGGNLGLTQAARIEFARRGGRLNTDFIDNAGGVNCSDHEVNLKILLAPEVLAGRLTTAKRNRLLRDIEPQVTADVLEANADQALLLSLDERRSQGNLAPFDRVMDVVCRRYGLKRSSLTLPSLREVGRRMQKGEGLARPELATLSSYVKMILYVDLVEDEAIEMEGIRPALFNYFPPRVRKRFAKAIDAHSLKREIALTRLTNRIVDHTGVTFFSEMAAETGASPRQTFEAYSMLSRAADAWHFKSRLMGSPVAPADRYGAFLTVEAALRASTLHLLENWDEDLIRRTLRSTDAYQKKIRDLAGAIHELLDEDSVATARAAEQAFLGQGFPEAMAQRLSIYPYLPQGLVVIDLAGKVKRPARELARDYFALGRASHLAGTIQRLDGHKARGYYDAIALRGLRRDLLGLWRELVVKLLRVKGSANDKLDTLGEGREAFERLDRIPAEQFGPAALMVSVDRIRTVLGGDSPG